MKLTTTIQKIIAAFMLILFSFSITPKKLLHDWVANHKDAKCTIKYPNKNWKHYTTGGYHCPTENLVVESPFENSIVHLNISVPVIYRQQICFFNKNYFSFSPSFNFLRGPPGC